MLTRIFLEQAGEDTSFYNLASLIEVHRQWPQMSDSWHLSQPVAQASWSSAGDSRFVFLCPFFLLQGRQLVQAGRSLPDRHLQGTAGILEQ